MEGVVEEEILARLYGYANEYCELNVVTMHIMSEARSMYSLESRHPEALSTEIGYPVWPANNYNRTFLV